MLAKSHFYSLFALFPFFLFMSFFVWFVWFVCLVSSCFFFFLLLIYLGCVGFRLAFFLGGGWWFLGLRGTLVFFFSSFLFFLFFFLVLFVYSWSFLLHLEWHSHGICHMIAVIEWQEAKHCRKIRVRLYTARFTLQRTFSSPSLCVFRKNAKMLVKHIWRAFPLQGQSMNAF